MPTKRRRKTRNLRQNISELSWAYFTEGPPPAEFNKFEELDYRYPTVRPDNVRPLWAAAKDAALEAWITRRPGTRPRFWWIFSAPRATDAEMRAMGYDDKGWAWRTERRPCSPRQRLGGKAAKGLPTIFEYGVPGCVLQSAKGLSLFESQASYLDRHGLLTPGEKRRLRKSDFKPVGPELIYGIGRSVGV
ncbi:MAG: hypothetical protein ACR2L2_07955 [Acidobacteriota bacterium]